MPARELDRIGPPTQAYAALAGHVHLSSGTGIAATGTTRLVRSRSADAKRLEVRPMKSTAVETKSRGEMPLTFLVSLRPTALPFPLACARLTLKLPEIVPRQLVYSRNWHEWGVGHPNSDGKNGRLRERKAK